MSSLRNKLSISHSASILALLFMAIMVFADLQYLRSQIQAGEQVRMLTSSIQQLRIQEENLLLRHQPEAYFQLSSRVESAREMFDRHRSSLEALVDSTELDSLGSELVNYSELLDALLEAGEDKVEGLKGELLIASESITRTVLLLEQRHHQLLSEVTDLVTLTLGIAVSLVTLVGILSAFFVIRQIIKPIRTLERQLDAVAEGEMNKLTLDSQDVEIQSFVQQFNSMLERLRSQQNQLRHHEKAAALGVLVSGVAHELNNPLSNISTSVQLLLEDDDTRPELRQQWLTHVDSEIERARRIVRRLLDSVRQPALEMECISAAELVRSAALLIHRQLDPNIFLHIEDVCESPVRVNLERFQQVFINLIRNAVDAGARNIWIFGDRIRRDDVRTDNIVCTHGKTSALHDADELLLFTVADDGPGIPEENLPQLFTPFFTTKTGGEGTGLGLYLVNETVVEHEGCISVKNRDEGGTLFKIWLPVSEEECS